MPRIAYLVVVLLAALPAGQAVLAADLEPLVKRFVETRPKLALPLAKPPGEQVDFLRTQLETDLGFIPKANDTRLEKSRSHCDKAENNLCYDAKTGKIVYKKTRALMPDLPGMRAENISLRRNRITFKYSFP